MEASDLLNAILELLPLFCTASVGESVRGVSTEPSLDCCWRKLDAELLLGLGGPTRYNDGVFILQYIPNQRLTEFASTNGNGGGPLIAMSQ